MNTKLRDLLNPDLPQGVSSPQGLPQGLPHGLPQGFPQGFHSKGIPKGYEPIDISTSFRPYPSPPPKNKPKKDQARKRMRRSFHEIERHYRCNYQGCTKSYGTLNHLNDHIQLQSHGPRQTPEMYRELRSQLRKCRSSAEPTSSEQMATSPRQHSDPPKSSSPDRPLKLTLAHLIH